MNGRTACLAAACASLLACAGEKAQQLPPLGQIVLYVTTDAQLPPGPGEPLELSQPPALFDRLRLDIYAPRSSEPCADCSREFELDRVRVSEREASIGIVPPPGVTGYVARARLYRAITVEGGEPPQLSTIDVHAELPAVRENGIIEVGLTLRVDDLGQPLGSLSAPVEVSDGKPDGSQVGSWPRAARLPCSGSAGPNEACVPGGAFWMGHPHAGLNADGSVASDTRLVVLSPFYVDLHEVTVGEYRAFKLARPEPSGGATEDPAPGPPEAKGLEGAATPADASFFCDYSSEALPAEQSRDSLALNCASWFAADAYCKAQGKSLPSEAQLEYLAGGLRSEPFLWGQDAPGCADSVWGRGGVGLYMGQNGTCRPEDSFGGPLAPGNGLRDRLPLEGGAVLDLMGNLSEWTRDHWNRKSEPCWSGKALLQDPECSEPSPSDGDFRTAKGRAWNDTPGPAARRFGRAPEQTSTRTDLGFRCVRPAE